MAKRKTASPEHPETAPAETPETTTSHSEGGTEQSQTELPASDVNGNAEPVRNGNGRRPVASWRFPVDKSTNVQVALWPNEITLQSGDTIEVLSLTIQRSYKDSRTGDWVNARTSFSFRVHELPVLLHAIGKAYNFALDSRQQDTPF